MMILPITIIWFSLAVIVIALIVKAVTAVVVRHEMEHADAREPYESASVPAHLSLEQDGPQRRALRGAGTRQMNSCLVMFENGFTAVTSRNALRRRKLEGQIW